MTQDDTVTAWLSLRRRIYLDSCTLQAMYDFGGVVFEEEPSPPEREASIDAAELDALRMIFLVNQRAMFEFVVTEASLRKVVLRRDKPRYAQWVYDVLDTWLIQTEGEEQPAPGTTFQERRFGMISVKDRRLLQDALDWRCDAFMTTEKHLPKNVAFIEKWTGLRVIRPSTYWGLLDRWANLYC